MSLYAIAFLIPLWFLPLTQDILVFQKQTLMVVLVFLGLISWLAKCINDGALQIRFTWIHVPVLLVILVMAISAMTSLWPYASFWGWPLDVKDSVLTFVAMFFVYFLVMQSIQESSQLFKMFMFSAVSLAIAGVYAILQLYGVFLIPFSFAKNTGFNTIGSSNAIAMIAAIMLPLSLVLAFSSKMVLRWLFWVLSLVFLAILALINFFDAWVVLACGLFVLLAFGMWNMRKRTEFGWVSFPMALLVVALFFGVFRSVSLPGAPQAPIEVAPSQQGEMSILKEVAKDRLLFGTGPGTFVLDYAKHHSPELNQTIFWGTRFSVGASEVLDWAMTKGVLGFLALLGVIGTTLFFSARALLKERSDTFSWMLGLGSFASFVGMSVALFMHPANFVIWLLFWMLLGALGIFVAGEPRKISIAPPSFLAVASSFLFLLVLIFGLGLLFIGGQKYAAEARYLQGARVAAAGDAKGAQEKIIGAARLNPAVDLYWRDLAQLYLNQVTLIGQDPNLKDEDKRAQTQTAVSNAVAASQQAVTRGANNVANWNVRGFIYRNLIAVPGADQLVIASYEKAIELDPSSPFSWTELGRAYSLQAQTLASQKNAGDTKAKQDEALNKALEKLNKAVELKADYAPAHYLIAVVYEQQGRAEEAVKKLEETKLVAPNDSSLAFQLGVIYWQREDLAKAKAELERAISLDANHANARYILGLVFDKQGDKAKAKEQFTKVLELNPDNEQIKKILDNLEKGRPVLEGIQPEQPPVPENPPEIGGKK